VLLGWTPLTWVLVIPMVVAWPAAGYLVYVVHRSGKRHDEREKLEREQALRLSEHP
jgi:hypothetical protein